MRYWITCCFLLGLGSLGFSQKTASDFALSYDHYAIIVEDLARSVDFYENVIGLRQIHNGTERDNIRWFDLGHGTALHVIESDPSEIRLNKKVHLSLTVADFDGYVAFVRAKQIPFEDWPGNPSTSNGRPDGARQIYFQDPDGYWLEINDAITIREE